MVRKKVAITIRSFDINGPAMELLKANCDIVYINTSGNRLNEPEVSRAIAGVHGVIAGTEPFSDKVIGSSDAIQVISRVGIGLDNIDTVFAEQKNVQICNTPLSPVQSVAEHTLALTLTLIKNIVNYSVSMRKCSHTPKPGILLFGKNVGIIGLGRIGSRVASLFDAFGCFIYYYDPFVPRPPVDSWHRIDTIDQLVTMTEIVSIHVSARPDSPPLVDNAVISRCKKGIIFINTSRGSLIDENALAVALESEIVAGAGLDVFSQEPYTGKLLSFPQVISTPHVASNTVESRREMEMEAVSNLLAAFNKMEKK